jgi:hypothetical protein
MKNNATYRLFSSIRDSPRFIKQACLPRNGFPAATWVETGTYLGLTIQLLYKHADRVCSIEPEPKWNSFGAYI